MRKILIANWKMNPVTASDSRKIFNSTIKSISQLKKKNNKFVICPPFLYLLNLKTRLKNAHLGAQDVFWEEKGAYTGEISPAMLKNLNIEYVIIGHSERRRLFKETDKIINKKVLSAVKAGLKVILCVGEPKQIRKKGISSAKKYINSQIKGGLKNISQSSLKNIIIAYEPLWAIGSGTPDTPESAAKISAFIKKSIKTKFYRNPSAVIYGGSVNSQNVFSFLKEKNIDGALVGGASIKPKEFGKMIKIIEKL